MPQPLEKSDKIYTYADYLNWNEDERIEIIDGEAYMIAPPSQAHQQVSVAIASQLYIFLEGKKCKVFPAPFAVRLFEGKNVDPDMIHTVVEPDISVICDKDKLDGKGCKGAPDMVVEILSPATAKRDKFVKLHLYRRAGVKEYWIVDPIEQSVQVFELDGTNYNPTAFNNRDDIAKVNALDGCFIELSRVFVE